VLSKFVHFQRAGTREIPIRIDVAYAITIADFRLNLGPTFELVTPVSFELVVAAPFASYPVLVYLQHISIDVAVLPSQVWKFARRTILIAEHVPGVVSRASGNRPLLGSIPMFLHIAGNSKLACSRYM
jgi:hypothetical protein